MSSVKPNYAEERFLTLWYNRFYDLFEEIFNKDFWDFDEEYRFYKIKNVFLVYTELLYYEPLRLVVDRVKDNRPPLEWVISKELFRTVRNIIVHFPFFDKWNDIYITKTMCNWLKEGQTIDNFFEKYSGTWDIKYRFWDHKNTEMTYLSISLPNGYVWDTKIYSPWNNIRKKTE